MVHMDGKVINAMTRTIPIVFTRATIANADKTEIRSSKKKALPPLSLNKLELKHEATIPFQKIIQHSTINTPNTKTK